MLSCMEPEAMKTREKQIKKNKMSWLLIKYVGLEK